MPTQIDRTRRGWPWQIGAEGEVLKVVNGWPTWDVDATGGGAGFDPGGFAWGQIVANPASPTLVNVGVPISLTAIGTQQFRAVSFISTPVESMVRVAVTAAAATNAICGWRSQSSYFAIGPSANVGGFTLKHRVVIGNGGATASHRFFAGLRDSLSDPTDVNPSTLTNLFGIGYDSADTEVQFMHNDGSGTATKIPLGASFPKPTAALTTAYDIELSATGGTGVVSYRVANLFTGAVSSGTVSTNLPPNINALNIWEYLSAGGTSTAVSLEASYWYFRLGRATP